MFKDYPTLKEFMQPWKPPRARFSSCLATLSIVSIAAAVWLFFDPFAGLAWQVIWHVAAIFFSALTVAHYIRLRMNIVDPRSDL